MIASLPSLALLTLAGMTPDRFEISYHERGSAGSRETDIPIADDPMLLAR